MARSRPSASGRRSPTEPPRRSSRRRTASSEVLDVSYQATLEESALPLTMSPAGTGTPAEQIGFIGPGGTRRPKEKVTDIDFHGAVGGYYREIWCHIPWVIADYLHSQGRYADAKRWYEAIFDPAAGSKPPANPAYKRVWQFREFREEPVESMRNVARQQGPGDGLRERSVQPARDRAAPARRVREGDGHAVRRQPARLGRLALHAVHRGVHQRGHDALHPGARHPRASGQKRRRLRRGEASRQAGQADQEGLRAPRAVAARRPRVPDRGREPLRRRRSCKSRARRSSSPRESPMPAMRWRRGTGAADLRCRATDGATQPFTWNQPTAGYWTMSNGTPLADFELGTTLDGENGTFASEIPDGRTFVLEGDPLDPPEVGLPEIPDKLAAGRPRRVLARQAAVPRRPVAAASGQDSAGQREALAAARLQHRLLHPRQQGAARATGIASRAGCSTSATAGTSRERGGCPSSSGPRSIPACSSS